jgi:hypothetical protein
MAIAAYRRISPSAPADRLETSSNVARMIAAAIDVDTKWFWHGPDA